MNSPEGANDEIHLCILTDTKFKKEIVKILAELRVNMKELWMDMNSNEDSFEKELENIRRNHEKLENSSAEMQTGFKSLKSRKDNAEEWISDLEDKIKITQSGQQTENQLKKHQSNIRDKWDNIKQSNLNIIEIQEEKEKWIEDMKFEGIMAENFPNRKLRLNWHFWDNTSKKEKRNHNIHSTQVHMEHPQRLTIC